MPIPPKPPRPDDVTEAGYQVLCQLTGADLQNMTAEEVIQAREDGRLAEYLAAPREDGRYGRPSRRGGASGSGYRR